MKIRQVAKIGAISAVGAVIAVAASQSLTVAFAALTVGTSGLVIKSYRRLAWIGHGRSAGNYSVL
jgi:hypothetical protein